jgi:predicted GNAT family N-acyltransferase
MITVPLDKKRHNRKRFDCGVKVLNNYLQMMANQQSSRDNTRTFVLEDVEDSKYIVGYYTLTMIAMDLTALPSDIQKKHPNSNSAALIARLAVDKRYKKNGFGEFLLVDSLKKLLDASNLVAFPLIVVDAKDGASDFYKRFGFISFFDADNKLFITVDSVRKSFKQ